MSYEFLSIFSYLVFFFKFSLGYKEIFLRLASLLNILHGLTYLFRLRILEIPFVSWRLRDLEELSNIEEAKPVEFYNYSRDTM